MFFACLVVELVAFIYVYIYICLLLSVGKILFLSLQVINSLKPNDNFRLWLTTESRDNFSTVLLQSSLKVTYEVSFYNCLSVCSLYVCNVSRMLQL